MPAALSDIMEKIDARVMRERVLIFLTLLAVIFFLWQFLLQTHIDKTAKALATESVQLANQQQELDAKIASLILAMASDPAIIKRKDIESLQRNILLVEAQLSGLSQGLIGVEQLPKVLQDMLARTATIKLLQVRTLPATELQLTAPIITAPANTSVSNSVLASKGAGVYKHSVLIRVSGSYSELVKFLQDIESLPWKFYWESLDYTVKKYPDAEIDIQVFTLSSEEGLFGV